jgi:hypothetical protein
MAQGSLSRRRTAAIAGLSFAALAACSSTPAPQPPTAAPPPVVTAPPPPTPTPPPRPAPPPADSCGAQSLQYLIGKPRSSIPVPVYPNRRRVICLGCPSSQDTFSWRQTIVYDLGTGRIRSVHCG